jgi:riboflavin synthase
MGGHYVQGHVDAVADVVSTRAQQGGTLLDVRLASGLMKYVISAGSICVDGVSLTVARLEGALITISLIGHTLEVTTLGNCRAGDTVNIEVDLIGKYVERILTHAEGDTISEQWLSHLGFK